MKKESVITINGQHYNAITGEKIEKRVEDKVSESKKDKDFSGFFDAITEEAKTVSRKPRNKSTKNSTPAKKKASTPAKKRMTKAEKEALIKQSILDDIEKIDAAKTVSRKPRNKSTKNSTPAKKKASVNWINNFAEGNAPIEIERIDRSSRKIKKTAETAKKTSADSKNIVRHAAKHARRKAQNSSTLNRKYVRAPKTAKVITNSRKKIAPVETHPMVSRFAKKSEPEFVDPAIEFKIPVNSLRKEFASSSKESRVRKSDVSPYKKHELEHIAKSKIAKNYAESFVTMQKTAQDDIKKFNELNSQKAAARQPRKTDSQLLKDALIREQLETPEVPLKSNRKSRKLEKQPRRRFHASTIAMAMVSAVLIGGYFAYVSMPNISLRMAAVQAGVNAKSPFTLNGYSQTGDVAYEAGQITVKYKNNSGGKGYSLTQSNTSLNSESIAKTIISDEDYTSINSGEMTIYKYGNTAVWVSDNTLFTLDGNEYMTDHQIEEIANSIRS